MKTKRNFFQTALLTGLLSFFAATAHAASCPATTCPTNVPIPWSELGAKAGADYHGDGLAVTATPEGARLHCVFQRLDGEATREGLWLTSTTSGATDRFQVKATQVGRNTGEALLLCASGSIAVNEKKVAFQRPQLREEYSVSMDGVRQDFVVMQKPAGAGALQVRLAVSGATVEKTPSGAQLILERSGRKIAYDRLRVTDANGKEISARMETVSSTEIKNQKSETSLAVVVNDAEATYPLRIDPTFSDANWVVLNPSIPGISGIVWALTLDNAGNLYVGGNFTLAGGVIANRVAKWNGSAWSALGSGMDNIVYALVVDSAGNLYAGGDFSTAGGVSANYIAKWNGSAWSAFNSGMDSTVYALSVDSAGNLYAGGTWATSTRVAPSQRQAVWRRTVLPNGMGAHGPRLARV
jgi:hypothetical protein